jgi:uncharacterized membrane protein YccC
VKLSLPVQPRIRAYFRRIGPLLATSPNQIAFVWALRGTIAAGIPLLCLPPLGLGLASHFIAIGALNTSMVDIGGTYRSRLNAMTFNSMVSPLALVLGSQAAEPWWLASLMMFFVALASGFGRALGAGGVPLGLMVGTAFLIGTSISSGLRETAEFSALYAAGGLWAILVTLVFWRLRPFKRLEQEVAAVWERTVALIAATRAVDTDMTSVVGRRKRERALANSHQALREAVERAREALGTVRAELSGPGTTTAQLMILVRAASRITAAVVTLAEIRGRHARHLRARDDGMFDSSTAELERTCHAIAASVLAGTPKFSLTAMRAKLREITAAHGGTHPEVMTFAQAMRNLENAAEAQALLLGSEQRFSGLLLPDEARGDSSGYVLSAIRAQLSPQSAIFRHAVRVAVAAAVGTAIMVRFELPHGIWLPMATLVVLQPEFGGTLSRAVQRTIGTAAGAVIAGALLAGLHGTLMLELVVVALLFAALFVQRRRYGLGVTFLTPLIVLLLATSIGDPWTDTLDRVIDTAAGAALGLFAGYFVWPHWERERLPGLLARAVRAERDYMVQVFTALGGAALRSEEIGEFRRRAEIAAGNAEAAFQRLLSEPRIQRGRIARAFAIVTYIQRLERHLIALASHIGSISLPEVEVRALLRLLQRAQEDVADAVAQDRTPPSCPAFDTDLGRLRSRLLNGEAPETARLVEFLLGKIVSDTTSLHFAASAK